MLGDQILHFSEFFYYLLSHFENRWSNGFTVLLSHRWISNFQSGLINSKKIQKNVKFGLQAHINMENKKNGSDRLFEFWNFKFGPCVFRPICYRKHISLSLSLSLYIYIYIYIWGGIHLQYLKVTTSYNNLQNYCF